MAETKNEQQPHSFKRKLGNTTYTVKVHFSKDTNKTFKDRVQTLIINECLEKNRYNPHGRCDKALFQETRDSHTEACKSFIGRFQIGIVRQPEL